MASSSHHSRSEVKQDYIARIRYSNKVPPPPNPPKLLNIPGTGLGDGHFLEGSYGARLVREQPLNIEVDSELGMPINLVGLPGIFDGDERCSCLPHSTHPFSYILTTTTTQVSKDLTSLQSHTPMINPSSNRFLRWARPQLRRLACPSSVEPST